MIDTHCHLLPGIDDGAKSREDSLELAAQLAAGGVGAVVCTPHYSRRYPTDHEDAVERGRVLAVDLEAAGVSLDLLVAAEVSPVLAATVALGELATRSIGGRFVVVELIPSTPAAFVQMICARLQQIELLPILAHPERCRAVQRHPELVDQARRSGALIQVVAPSLLGNWGQDVANAAWWLIEAGRADLLASDAHGTRDRPELRTAAERVAKRAGERVLHRLTATNPRSVLVGLHPSEAPNDPADR
jgi:protein-tyrosine phosphatase